MAMNIDIYLDSENRSVKKYVDETIKKMNAHQSEFQLLNGQGTVKNQDIRNTLNGANKISFNRIEARVEQIIGNDKCVIITDKPFDDNWFSHSADNFWLVSVSDWEDVYAPPHMDKYLQYEIIQFLICCGANLSVAQMHRNAVHFNTTDCLFDFCINKSDIKISMRTGRICEDCKRNLSDFGLSNTQFQALNFLIKIMTGKATFEKVFIVHGHGEHKETVAHFIENIGLQPIILSEQPNRSRTIIENFETYSDVDFAIVLYTPDDTGGIKTSPYNELKPRARQNVVFEHGYFTAKLGRENVIVLLKDDTEKIKLEMPGDNDGIIYVPFDEHGGWKEKIKQALRQSGYRVP
jgi:predicted nucleotide-binding protein